MIPELLRLAKLNGLTGHEAFRARPIDWVIDLDQEGRLLELSPTAGSRRGRKSGITRGKLYEVPRNYHMQVRDGSVLSVCTNQSNWLPDFLVGPPDELFVRGIDGKQDPQSTKRRLTWGVCLDADRDLGPNSPITAIVRFLLCHKAFDPSWIPGTSEEREAALKRLTADQPDLISFRVGGALACRCPELRAWWASRIARQRERVLELLPPGTDFYQEGAGKLTDYAPVVFNSIPFVSYDKAPFMSFGLGKQTTPYRLETAEKAAAGLNLLLNADDCHMRLGDLTAVFWAANAERTVPADFTELLGEADPLSVKDFLTGLWASRESSSDLTRFHAAVLSKTKGRFAVRGWHTDTLPNAQANVRRWLGALAVRLPYSDDDRYASIPELAECTVRRSKNNRPSAGTYLALFESALFGTPLPDRLLAASLLRQAVEIGSGAGSNRAESLRFEDRLASRTAVVKLYFELTKGISMTDMSEKNSALERDAGYICGRLLAILDKIHQDAHRSAGGTNSSPANRSYAAASTTPALIFPQLCQLARYHLNKIGGGWAHNLEFGYPALEFEGLAAICARLRSCRAGEFPATLNLHEQGRFAIGFYYERCRRWPAGESPPETVASDTSGNENDT